MSSLSLGEQAVLRRTTICCLAQEPLGWRDGSTDSRSLLRLQSALGQLGVECFHTCYSGVWQVPCWGLAGLGWGVQEMGPCLCLLQPTLFNSSFGKSMQSLLRPDSIHPILFPPHLILLATGVTKDNTDSPHRNGGVILLLDSWGCKPFCHLPPPSGWRGIARGRHSCLLNGLLFSL